MLMLHCSTNPAVEATSVHLLAAIQVQNTMWVRVSRRAGKLLQETVGLGLVFQVLRDSGPVSAQDSEG